VKTYLALAKRDKIKFENPYQDFKNRDAPGQWKPLRTAELEKLEAYYQLCAPRTIYRRVLARFLFSCCSSLRLGDLKQVGNAAIENREMTFRAQKTYSKTLRETMLPLTREALPAGCTGRGRTAGLLQLHRPVLQPGTHGHWPDARY
jgi:hypothetical protein